MAQPIPTSTTFPLFLVCYSRKDGCSEGVNFPGWAAVALSLRKYTCLNHTDANADEAWSWKASSSQQGTEDLRLIKTEVSSHVPVWPHCLYGEDTLRLWQDISHLL